VVSILGLWQEQRRNISAVLFNRLGQTDIIQLAHFIPISPKNNVLFTKTIRHEVQDAGEAALRCSGGHGKRKERSRTGTPSLMPCDVSKANRHARGKDLWRIGDRRW